MLLEIAIDICFYAKIVLLIHMQIVVYVCVCRLERGSNVICCHGTSSYTDVRCVWLWRVVAYGCQRHHMYVNNGIKSHHRQQQRQSLSSSVTRFCSRSKKQKHSENLILFFCSRNKPLP